MNGRSPDPFHDINNFGPRVVILVVALVVGLVLVISACHIVPPGHRGVLETFGKPHPEFKTEGLHFKLPFAQKIINRSIRQTTRSDNALAYTADQQEVQIEYDVLFSQPQAQVVNLYQNFEGELYASLIRPRVQEQVKQSVAQYSAEELLKNRNIVKDLVLTGLRERVEDVLNIADVTITSIQLSPELVAEIERKQMAEQQVMRAEFDLERARREAEAVRVMGEAVRQNPQVLDREIIQKWDGRSPMTVVTGSGSGGGTSILLPPVSGGR